MLGVTNFETRSYSMPLLSGDPGTEQTIDAIRSIVDQSWKNSDVVNQAAQIVIEAGVPQSDSLGKVEAGWRLGAHRCKMGAKWVLHPTY